MTRRRTIRDDDGFATVWAAGAVVGLLVVLGLLAWLGAAAVARHRATSAADLAALAAAAYASDGPSAACGRARLVTGRMGARLGTCELSGLDALVRVTVQPPGLLSEFGPAEARARAGPVDDQRRAVSPGCAVANNYRVGRSPVDVKRYHEGHPGGVPATGKGRTRSVEPLTTRRSPSGDYRSSSAVFPRSAGCSLFIGSGPDRLRRDPN